LSPFSAVEEQLNAAQAEAAELHRANDDLAWQTTEAILLRRDADDNARIAAQLLAENRFRFDAVNLAAVAAIRTGATLEQRLRCGGLRGLEPRFLPWSSFHDREDLIVYF